MLNLTYIMRMWYNNNISVARLFIIWSHNIIINKPQLNLFFIYLPTYLIYNLHGTHMIIITIIIIVKTKKKKIKYLKV